MKNKKIILTLIIAIAIVLCMQIPALAYQSVPSGRATSIDYTKALLEIRKMEERYKGMGLTEKLDETTLQSTDGSNKVDVHMQKNTEYGAMLILSSSFYGKQGNGTKGSNYINSSSYGLATTTGNKTGIYEVGLANENVSATYGETFLSSVKSRYINRYLDSNPFIGDATLETSGWRGSSAITLPNGANALMYRNIFSGASSTSTYSTRACMVITENNNI